MIWFTSDFHFGHEAIIRMCQRPFSDVEEMNRVLLENYNSFVQENDTVYILGDVCHRINQEERNEFVRRLKGKKILIIGNHDLTKGSQNVLYDSSLFEDVRDYLEIHYEGNRICMSHYPFLSWRGAFQGSYMVHGHTHNHSDYNERNKEKGLRRYDVGVDANEYCPVRIQDILAYFPEDKNSFLEYGEEE